MMCLYEGVFQTYGERYRQRNRRIDRKEGRKREIGRNRDL
jgi:hypothetical protein